MTLYVIIMKTHNPTDRPTDIAPATGRPIPFVLGSSIYGLRLNNARGVYILD